VREPGAFTWTELNTRDLEGSKAFYEAVFGWGAVTSGEDGPMPYTEFKVAGESVAGCMTMTDEMPAEVPPHWLAYVEVADADAAAEKATSLGGSVVVPPMDFPGGRFAIVTDPQGATLGLMHSTA
jgi:predicted enzyme related to lactoylglutathione lyase